MNLSHSVRFVHRYTLRSSVHMVEEFTIRILNDVTSLDISIRFLACFFLKVPSSAEPTVGEV